MILLTGFRSFPGVGDNPTQALAQGLHGRMILGQRVHAQVLDVTYQGLSERLKELEQLHRPSLVVGLGVAKGSERVRVELCAYNRVGPSPDNSGVLPKDLGAGPEQLQVALPTAGLRAALNAVLSQDAGTYVCNAWLYTALRDLRAPALFIHVPLRAPSAEQLERGLCALWREHRPTP